MKHADNDSCCKDFFVVYSQLFCKFTAYGSKLVSSPHKNYQKYLVCRQVRTLLSSVVNSWHHLSVVGCLEKNTLDYYTMVWFTAYGGKLERGTNITYQTSILFTSKLYLIQATRHAHLSKVSTKEKHFIILLLSLIHNLL